MCKKPSRRSPKPRPHSKLAEPICITLRRSYPRCERRRMHHKTVDMQPTRMLTLPFQLQPTRLKRCLLPKDALMFLKKRQVLHPQQGMRRQMYIQKIGAKKKVTRMTPHLGHQNPQDDVVAAIIHMRKRALRVQVSHNLMNV